MLKCKKKQQLVLVHGVILIFSHVALQGGLSVDCISDLVESQSRLLEALQLSHPAELELKKSASDGRTQTKLSLNPIYRQVPRVVERCCSHIENYGETSRVVWSSELPPYINPYMFWFKLINVHRV